MLANTRIVLVNPSHPGNIGAAARAMKNMGLTELYLVAPKTFPSQEAIVRASGADDVLASATIVHNLIDALCDCHVVYGTSARVRTLEKPSVSPRECALNIHGQALKAAIVFGRENTGLTNEELSMCHQHIIIPTAGAYSSLNLAAAVQVIAYELFVAQQASMPINATTVCELAPADQVLGFYEHLQQVLIAINFLDPKQPKMLMQRLRRLFNRTQLDSTEINILRGILSRVEWLVDKKSA